MEQKTIGKFISALRKAEGMTQKDLAEKLNVSDKSISRWERDEGAPDISVIPVIAEVFGVTCDELLRGERKPAAERTEAPAEEKSVKAEKQLKRLLKLSVFRFKSQSYISMGIAAVGFIAALVADLAFTAALLGFFLALAFIVAALICEAIFVNRAFLSVEDAEFDAGDLNAYKRNVIRLAEFTIGLELALLGFVFPLLFIDAYLGLLPSSLLFYGGISAVAFLLIYCVILYFINHSLVTKGLLLFTDKEEQIYNYRHKLKKYTAVALAAVLLVTGIIHYSCTILYGPGSVMKGITFEDYESFIAYMEEDIQPTIYYSDGTASVPVREEEVDAVWYDMEGNEISEEKSRRKTLEDINGKVVCEYVQWNDNVCSISYSPKDGTVLPITVRSYDDLHHAKIIIEARHKIFALVYSLEAVAAIGIYFVLRNKKKIK